MHSWIALVLAADLLPAAFLRRIAYEERLLADALPGYRDDMARTGALLPKLG